MSKKKFAALSFAFGIVILFIALYLLFNTNSAWALITLGASIIFNTAGLTALMMK